MTGHFRLTSRVCIEEGPDAPREDSKGRTIPPLGYLGAGKLITTNKSTLGANSCIGDTLEHYNKGTYIIIPLETTFPLDGGHSTDILGTKGPGMTETEGVETVYHPFETPKPLVDRKPNNRLYCYELGRVAPCVAEEYHTSEL